MKDSRICALMKSTATIGPTTCLLFVILCSPAEARNGRCLRLTRSVAWCVSPWHRMNIGRIVSLGSGDNRLSSPVVANSHLSYSVIERNCCCDSNSNSALIDGTDKEQEALRGIALYFAEVHSALPPILRSEDKMQEDVAAAFRESGIDYSVRSNGIASVFYVREQDRGAAILLLDQVKRNGLRAKEIHNEK